MKSRTLKQASRFERIHKEFIKGFWELYHLGPAVTVFGSARFKDRHPYYHLAREVGKELARAGFATLTGGRARGSWKHRTEAPLRLEEQATA